MVDATDVQAESGKVVQRTRGPDLRRCSSCSRQLQHISTARSSVMVLCETYFRPGSPPVFRLRKPWCPVS